LITENYGKNTLLSDFFVASGGEAMHEIETLTFHPTDWSFHSRLLARKR
jgi:hypothetical protein